MHIISYANTVMGKRYLFFASLSYSYPILRPLQEEIRRRGDEVAWFLEDTCLDLLTSDEKRLNTIDEVMQYNPIAIFAPGDYIYDFFPGVKVRVCHGYPIYKRGGNTETHFKIRGWFDIYLTSGESSTPIFYNLEKKHGNFKVYETGWSKVDAIINAKNNASKRDISSLPTIFVATTFTSYVSALSILYPIISKLVKEREWNWKITMHPKLNDPELKQRYSQLAQDNDNVEFYPVTPNPDVMADSDVMLCDSSSIILEYMLLDKPVVTYRNTTPGKHLINVENINEIEEAIEKALTRPDDLMKSITKYIEFHERHKDGLNCQRILNAVDDFVGNHQSKMKKKPLNLFRKLKLRKRLNYWKW